MADLKPIGSEKLQGQDKINRILELSRYKETTPSNINETSRVEFGKTFADVAKSFFYGWWTPIYGTRWNFSYLDIFATRPWTRGKR